ncbi:organomercurial lyase [Streptomyces sp. NPDC059534]|uniref:organomercurial lyase n=1 Tax=Streptomyces sp. NPDC059534 TaxID=3346859 RepID=UPI00369A647A
MTENASTAPLSLDETEKVRLAVYRGFARTGRAPSVPELSALTALAPDRVRQELRTLHARHDLVLDPQDEDRVVMAHPFASVPLGFSVMGTHTLWWGGCAWDSFLTPMNRAWDDVVHTCGNQRLFCSTDCVDTWLRKTGHVRGYVMDLPTLWRFAGDWYTGRLDAGYVRRDPAAAASYFAEVGLRGSFWGLPD